MTMPEHETTPGMIFSRPTDALYATPAPEPSEAHVMALIRQDEKRAERMSAEVETYQAVDGHLMENHKGASSAYAWHSDACACITNPEAWY